MILTKKEAMVVLGLNQLNPNNRNMYGIEAIAGISAGTAYRLLRVLQIKGAVRKIETLNKKRFFQPTAEGLDEASSHFSEEEEVPLHVL